MCCVLFFFMIFIFFPSTSFSVRKWPPTFACRFVAKNSCHIHYFSLRRKSLCVHIETWSADGLAYAHKKFWWKSLHLRQFRWKEKQTFIRTRRRRCCWEMPAVPRGVYAILIINIFQHMNSYWCLTQETSIVFCKKILLVMVDDQVIEIL